MQILIEPGKLKGSIKAQPSKSDWHRAIICSAIKKSGKIIIQNDTEPSDDIAATIDCCEKAFNKRRRKKVTLNCKESATTLRLLLPAASMSKKEIEFSGEGRLPERPVDTLVDEMKRHGFEFSAEKLPFTVSHEEISDEPWEIESDISSQFLSGLLISGLLKETEVKVSGDIVSAGYVDMTVDTLRRFKAEVDITDEGEEKVFRVSPGDSDEEIEYEVEGDWSNAAFFLAAGVEVEGLNEGSLQPDKAIRKYLKYLKEGSGTGEISVKNNPDLLPILAVVSSIPELCGFEKVKFIDTKRLKKKESDRVASTISMINSLGGRMCAEDGEIVTENIGLLGGTVNSYGDHRIVMASAIAACYCERAVLIEGAEAVNKSYPGFFADLDKLRDC